MSDMENAERTLDRTMELKASADSASPGPAAPRPETTGENTTISMPARSMEADPSAPPPSVMPGAVGRGRTTATPKPLFAEGAASTLESRIPEGMSSKRPSPALDPIRRAQISGLAKWGILIAILMFLAWAPAYLYKGEGENRALYFMALVTTATVFASVVATGLPRILMPKAFGKWHEAAEALRDWLIVGVATGVIYCVFIQIATGMHVPDARELPEWIKYRLPMLLIASLIAVPVARTLAIRREGLLGVGIGNIIWQSVLQIALLGALERPIEMLLSNLFTTIKGLEYLFGGAGLLCMIVAGSVIVWAAGADASLATIRKRRRGGSGFDDGTGPVKLTLTVIGGRESGKTVLLAAAYYEWSTQHIGHLRITPALDAVGFDGTRHNIANLEEVARELYVENQFPVGTVSTQNLPFDLSFGQEVVARFNFLDYPGGAIAGRVADNRMIQEFWERVEDTDGIMMIADMSYVRRARKDSDWLEVRNAYRTVMQRLVDRNGKRRVVPVALVLTKCDEFVDPASGHIDMKRLQEGLREFQYDELEAEWRQLNNTSGPGFAEFSTWITSAITYSQPQLGANGRPDYTKPFMIAPPPPPIAPTGCASPLLWMTAKVMRWNVTAFYDISSFLMGSTPRIRGRVESILEMEKIAEQRAGRA